MPAIEPGPSIFHPVLLCDSNLIPSQGVNSNYMQYRDSQECLSAGILEENCVNKNTLCEIVRIMELQPSKSSSDHLL